MLGTPKLSGCVRGQIEAIYRLPLLLARRIITRGPAEKMKRTAANCKKISKFIAVIGKVSKEQRLTRGKGEEIR
jgi:hypothetical protein